MTKQANMRGTRWWIPGAIALLALSVYAPGFNWGVPHATSPNRTASWGVDDETPLGAIGQVMNFVSPSPDRNVGYPRMHPILVTSAYAPYLAWLWMQGEISQPSDEYPFGMTDPVSSLRFLGSIGHLVSVLLAVGIVLCAYDIGRLAWNRATGVWAALFVMTLYPIFYYARTGNVDVTLVFFLAAATACIARIATKGLDLRRSIVLASCAGAALATKEVAAGVLFVIPLVVWSTARPKANDPVTRRAFWRTAILGATAGLVVYALTSGLLLDFGWFVEHIRHHLGRVEHFAKGSMAASHSYTLSGHLGWFSDQLGYLATCQTPIGLLLALSGIACVVFRGRERIWLVWLAAGYFAFLFIALRGVQLRYVLPLAFFLAIFAGHAVDLAWRARTKWIRYGVVTLAIGSLAFGYLNGASLTYEMIWDSRYAAGEWLADRLEPGDRIEYFGASQTLPALPEGVVSAPATEFHGMFVQPEIDDAKVAEIIDGWRARQPRYVLVIPDYTSKPGVEHSFVLPPQLFRSMLEGDVEYRLVAEFQTPSLFRWLSPPALDYPTVNPPVRIFEATQE